MNETQKVRFHIWRIYFFASGFLGFLLWNSLLNIAEYLSLVFSTASLLYIFFVFSFAGIIAVFIFPFFIRFFAHRTLLNLSIFSSLLLLAFSFYACEATNSSRANYWLALGGFSLLGCANGALQMRLAGLTAYLSVNEVRMFGKGAAMAGMVVSLTILLAGLATANERGRKLLSDLRWELVFVGLVVMLSFIGFFFVQAIFDLCYHQMAFLSGDSEIEKIAEPEVMPNDSSEEQDEEKIGIISDNANLREEKENKTDFCFPKIHSKTFILRNSLDLLLGMCFLQICSVFVIPFACLKSVEIFDREIKWSSFSLFLLCFSFCDYFGKSLNANSRKISNELAHFLILIRAILPIYFFVILFTEAEFISHGIAFRMFFIILLGISNGFLTNLIFTLADKRFSVKHEKSHGLYFLIIAMLIGINFGIILSIIINRRVS